MAYPERIVPDETEPGIVALHLKRYDFAIPWCRDKHALDAACGTGYGSALLAEHARRVVGVDASIEAIDYARGRYGGGNVEFEVMDVERLAFANATFDAVCSFETIEHLGDREAFLGEVSRVLRDDGVLIVSTPRAAATTYAPENPFHHVEYSPADFEALLRRFFADVDLYGQRRRRTLRHTVLVRLDVLGLRRHLPASKVGTALAGTPPTADLTLDDVLITKDRIDQAAELVAVCRRPLPR